MRKLGLLIVAFSLIMFAFSCRNGKLKEKVENTDAYKKVEDLLTKDVEKTVDSTSKVIESIAVDSVKIDSLTLKSDTIAADSIKVDSTAQIPDK